jgi:hypothetical protein
VSNGRSCNEYRNEGRFDGPSADCEQVPLLPARAVAWVLDDPRKIPYLLIWKKSEDCTVREVVRVSAYCEPRSQDVASWAEIKRPDGTRDLIRTLLKPLPRNGGKARLLICPHCQIPRRGLYGWEQGGPHTTSVRRSSWGCRKCSFLRYASEGGALLIRPRGMLGLVFGTGYSPRPESWLPYVFTSPKEVAETGLDTDGLAVLDSCHDVIDSIPTLMRDEKAQKEGNERFLDVCESFRYGVMSYANEQAIPREVETQREIRKIGDDTQKYLRYLELTAKRTNSIAFTIPRRRWFH